MKKTLLATATLLALTACGTKTVYVTAEPASTTKAPTTQPATTQAPEPEFTPGSTSDFIIAVESLIGTLYVAEAEVIETGMMTCDFLRNGASAYDVSDLVYSNPDPEFIAAIVAASVIVLCPDQKWKFDEAITLSGA